MLEVKNKYDQVFELEIKCWCQGILSFEGEIDDTIIFRIVTELKPAYLKAIQSNYVFNLINLASKLSKSAKFLVNEKEIAFAILTNLPNPSKLNEDELFVLGQIIDQVEQTYGGALDRLQKKWSWEKKAAIALSGVQRNV